MGTQRRTLPESRITPPSIEMPRPTAAPLVLALGVALLAGGLPFGLGFFIIGGMVIIAGLYLWIAQLLPGRGHVQEEIEEPVEKLAEVQAEAAVTHLHEGMPGYRLLLPTSYHPISSGVKGGIAGGIVMPITAMIWGVMTGHGIWYPVNLVAGMILPGIDKMSDETLQQFNFPLFMVAGSIHIVMSLIIGLIFGVLLPTLPTVSRAIAWGGLLAPLLWSGVSYALVKTMNPVMEQQVSWPWFIAAQFVFGAVITGLIRRSGRYSPLFAGFCGGLAGSIVMPIHAFIDAIGNDHTIWYPINMLAGMVLRELGDHNVQDLELFNARWFGVALAIHLTLSLGFAILYSVLLPRLPHIPGPLAWGGLVLPLLWSGSCYGLMGVVNPALQTRVDWPGFVLSQFVFGITAAIVVLRTEMVHLAPLGKDRGGRS
ncbi:MAG TPA: hypothetical protein PLN21_01980 [Gemmatales bacterium]|nr:hypothetical protein [Gemmatales bacterium]